MSKNQPNTLGSALPDEMARCEELIKLYDALGNNGRFASGMIKAHLAQAQQAIDAKDPLAMLEVYKILRGHE